MHIQVFKEINPLIKKRQAGERLSNDEQFLLESVGQKIREELLK